MILGYTIRNWIRIACAILICSCVHEAAHGLTAYKLGDSTAKYDGRLSLNPLKHIDIFGFLCIMFFGFGWAAKPIRCTVSNFKYPDLYVAIVALAGPVSNFIFGFLLMIIYYILSYITYVNHFYVLENLQSFIALTAQYSVFLGVFNLIPIHPLDGAKAIEPLLPEKIRYLARSYENYGLFILLMILYIGIIDYPLLYVSNGALSALSETAFSLVDFFAGVFV